MNNYNFYLNDWDERREREKVTGVPQSPQAQNSQEVDKERLYTKTKFSQKIKKILKPFKR